MTNFTGLMQKISSWKSNAIKGSLTISGIAEEHLPFIFNDFLKMKGDLFHRSNHLFICDTLETAEELHTTLLTYKTEHKLYFFPGLDEGPYGHFISSESSLYKRFKVLDSLVHRQEKSIIIATHEAAALRLPPVSFFSENQLKLETSDIISPQDLALKLVHMGYSPATSIEEPGTFCNRGEIFDLFTVTGEALRIHYFDDMIEEIFPIDRNTQKTIRTTHIESVGVAPAPQIFSGEVYRTALRENLIRPRPSEKAKHERRKDIFSALSDGAMFENYPAYCSQFFTKTATLLDYIDGPIISLINGFKTTQNITELIEQLRYDYSRASDQEGSELLLPPPESLYNHELMGYLENSTYLSFNEINISQDLDDDLSNTMELQVEKISGYLGRFINPAQGRFDYLKQVLNFIKEEFKYSGTIVFSSANEGSRKEISFLLEENEVCGEILSRIRFENAKLSSGFYYAAENILVLTDSDLFSRKKSKAKDLKPKNLDLFAEQLATLKEGDFVIHSEHGIGIYHGLQTMDVGDTQTDYLVIHYADNDKVYVPVYKMNMIQKHADGNSGLKAANLRSNKFSALKEKAKNSVKKLAFDLLKLQAERQSSPAYAFSEQNHLDNEFALAFPFEETNDQRLAIDDVLEAMQKPTPMDHLVCGDVGFGKTEVAMRAAFKAVNDGKQVAVLVPTTILAMQHYNSFTNRFKDFPITIEFLSRFKTAAQVKKIKDELTAGKIDVLIGTHKILSASINFKDIGLVVVDEEQRFGVGHKEKLKLMKSSVDFLTLTATPIPRTMQLAFLGLRDLSLIQTAPPRRQSIKTYLIKEDDQTLKAAIEKELSRGGQVFYVHNRVADMEEYSARLRELVPGAKVVVAHGQMSERELETKMKDFYSGKYQILLSTTIIESGIDIPNANTMIVDRADTYGLSQLHQLRGRIGRSDRKAYAYFVIPKNRGLTKIAESRLKALQTYADMGSGFSIASADLEIRGAGDILGAQQSGHIEAVGLELYMELLKEAIFELRGEKKIIRKNIEINTPFASFIPSHYVKDSAERLKYYKKLSNCESLDGLEQIKEELVDIFGIYPVEMQNLFTILETRISLQHVGLKAISVAGTIISLQFDQQSLDRNIALRNAVVEVFMKRPKIYQFTPDYRVIYSHKTQVDQKELLNFAKDVAQQLVTC